MFNQKFRFGEHLQNLIPERARSIYKMGTGKVHIAFSKSSTFILALLTESPEYTGTEFVSE